MNHVDSIACHDCDLLHRVAPLSPGGTARCQRCGATLYREPRNSLNRALALALTSLVLFVMANTYTFMSFRIEGRVQENTMLTGVVELWRSGMIFLALLVLFASILAPLLKIAGLLYVLIPVKLGRRPWRLAHSYRFVEFLRPWGMLDVYMLGVIVAIIKLSQLATIRIDVAFYSFVALMIVSTAAAAALNPRLIWERLS